ncbi:hypothetical protein GF354_06740 [Candidatus Peregrinibacteria bacterium]|nr:hypothetical protein [Candidatus Peregrinibacteria bacterium]
MNKIRYKLILLVVLSILLTPFNKVNSENFIDYWIEESKENDSIGAVYMKGEFLDGDIIKISIYADGFTTPVLGIAFHMIYENEKVEFLKYEPGKFLENGGDPFYLVDNNPLKQKIYFGSTLRREDKFPLGGDKLADFYFQNKNHEDFVFEFSDGVVSTLDTVRQDIDNIEWEDLHLSINENIKNTHSVDSQDVQASVFNTNPKMIYIMLIPSIFTLLLIISLVVLFFKYAKGNLPLSSQ